MDKVDSRASREEKLQKRAGGFACHCMKMFCEKELGMEYKDQVSNMGTPRDSSVLKLG